MLTNKSMSHSALASQDRRDYRLIYLTAYPVCLLGAVVERVLPRRERGRAAGWRGRRSILGQARASARLAASAALMG